MYTATLHSFFKPFSFSTLNSNTAALGKLNLLKAWGRTFASCDLTTQFCQDINFQKISIWKFSNGYSKRAQQQAGILAHIEGGNILALTSVEWNKTQCYAVQLKWRNLQTIYSWTFIEDFPYILFQNKCKTISRLKHVCLNFSVPKHMKKQMTCLLRIYFMIFFFSHVISNKNIFITFLKKLFV